MSATRILHVLPSLDERSGGPIRAVLDLSYVAQSHGLHSELVGPGPMRLNDNPLDPGLIHATAPPTFKPYAYSPDLRAWLEANVLRFDGVVSHGMWLHPNWLVGSVCQKAGVPYACFPHGMLDLWSVQDQGSWKRWKKYLYWHLREKQVFHKAAHLLFTTVREMNNASRTYTLNHDNLQLVPYGIKTTGIRVASAPDSRIAALASTNYILFLSRVHPKKNVHLLLEAWGTAARPDGWKLCIAGSAAAPYKATLMALVTKYKLEDSVLFLDHVSGDNKSFLFQNAKWFVLPSSQENFGVAVLEAISHRCPVVISDQVYLADHFHSRSEVLPVSLSEWRRFVEERMADEHHRQTVVTADELDLLPRFSMDRVAADWASMLTLCFKQPGNRRQESQVVPA